MSDKSTAEETRADELSPEELKLAKDLGIEVEPTKPETGSPPADTAPAADKPPVTDESPVDDSADKPEPETTDEEIPEPQIPDNITPAEARKQIAGLVKDLKKERTKRHAGEETIQSYKDQLAYLQEVVETVKKPAATDKADDAIGPDPLAGKTDDDVITVAEWKNHENWQRKIDNRNQAAAYAEERLIFLRKVEQDAVKKYAPDKTAKGLDWTSVFVRAKAVMDADESIRRIVYASDDPAEAAYRVGLIYHPDSIKLLTAQGVSAVTEKLTTKRPATVKSSGAASGVTKLSDLSEDELTKQSPDKILAEIERLEKEGK
ncbi:MAG: hypothetical protein QME51_01745 [Planctomycetota bacterium]|nr:hypothetical protein [Planctomycetota bacterium]